MEAEIIQFEGIKLIGLPLEMSLLENKTSILWNTFMVNLKKLFITPADLYSVQLYDSGYFKEFSPKNTFIKWAAVTYLEQVNFPKEMEILHIPAGTYARFLYKGKSSDGAKAFSYIFNDWLPGSDFALDQRPHFELLGEKYKNDNPESEELIYIPIKLKFYE